MFTGIITGVGQIVALDNLGPSADHGKRLRLQTPEGYLSGVSLGDSIALNGACMTVTTLDLGLGHFSVDVSAESLSRTCGLDVPGSVNLEQAVRGHDRLGGHIVSGHVDGIGRVLRFEPVGESWLLEIHAPPDLAAYLAYKGSVAVNGVSLTVNRVQDQSDGCVFGINLIPHTVQHTTLGLLQTASPVNLEIDTVARYVHRMLSSVHGPARKDPQ